MCLGRFRPRQQVNDHRRPRHARGALQQARDRPYRHIQRQWAGPVVVPAGQQQPAKNQHKGADGAAQHLSIRGDQDIGAKGGHQRRRAANGQDHAPISILEGAGEQLDGHNEFHQQHHRHPGLGAPKHRIDRRQDHRGAKAGIAAHQAGNGGGECRAQQPPIGQQRQGSIDEVGHLADGASIIRSIRRALINTLPACSKLTVTHSPTTDWTWPRPQSASVGWRTRMPGSIKAITIRFRF